MRGARLKTVRPRTWIVYDGCPKSVRQEVALLSRLNSDACESSRILGQRLNQHGDGERRNGECRADGTADAVAVRNGSKPDHQDEQDKQVRHAMSAPKVKNIRIVDGIGAMSVKSEFVKNA